MRAILLQNSFIFRCRFGPTVGLEVRVGGIVHVLDGLQKCQCENDGFHKVKTALRILFLRPAAPSSGTHPSSKLYYPRFAREYRSRRRTRQHPLAYGHLQHLIDVLALVQNLENTAFVSCPFALFADQFDVGQELHLDSDRSIALTDLTTATGDIEGKTSGIVTARLRLTRGSENVADVIECLDIGHRIRSWSASNGTLVHENNVGYPLQTAFDNTSSGAGITSLQYSFNCFEQAIMDERGLART